MVELKSRPGGEMADTQRSERCSRKALGVRISPWTLTIVTNLRFFLLLGIIAAVGYWRTLQIYPYNYDWDIFLRILHPDAGIWNYTPQQFLESVHRNFAFPVNLIFPVFKFNFPFYFLTGIFTYFLSAVAFYFLLFEVSKNKFLSSVTAIFYLSLGYFSWETIRSIDDLHQFFGALLFIFLTLLFILKHLRTQKLWQYFLSLILFAFASEYYILRTAGLIFLIPATMFLFLKIKKEKRNLLNLAIKFIPLLIIYKIEFSKEGSVPIYETLNIFKNNPSEILFFLNYPATFSNSLIPGYFFNFTQNFPNVFSSNLFLDSVGFGNLEIAWAISGSTILLFLIILARKKWNENKTFSRLLFFSIIWFLINYSIYFVGFADDNFKPSLLLTGSKYITVNIVSSSIILSCLIFMLGKKVQYLTIFLLVAFGLISTNIKITQFVKERDYVRALHKEIKAQTSILPPKPVLFIEYKNSVPYEASKRSEHPNNRIAIYRESGKFISEVNSFEELVDKLKNNKTTINNILSFYVNDRGVQNTTEQTKKILMEQKHTSLSKKKELCDVKTQFNWKDDTTKNFISGYNSTSKWPQNLYYWIVHHNAQILIDQGKSAPVNKISWTNHLKQTSPADYAFFVSNDKKKWTEILSIKNGPLRKEGELVIDTFPSSSNTRYIKMIITRTHSGYSPSILNICPSN